MSDGFLCCWVDIDVTYDPPKFMIWDNYPRFYEGNMDIPEGELPEIWFWENPEA